MRRRTHARTLLPRLLLLAAAALPVAACQPAPQGWGGYGTAPVYGQPAMPSLTSGQAIGAATGGLAGALIGNQAAGRGSRTIGTVGGAAAGALVGGLIGGALENRNQQQPPAGQAGYHPYGAPQQGYYGEPGPYASGPGYAQQPVSYPAGYGPTGNSKAGW